MNEHNLQHFIQQLSFYFACRYFDRYGKKCDKHTKNAVYQSESHVMAKCEYY